LEFAGSDGAPIENQTGNVQTGQGHDAAGNGFVAAHQNHQRVKKISTGHQFDGVGDDFAADERSFHSFSAHGDAVGNGNGVEFEGRTTGFANAILDVLSEFAQVVVAGPDFNPGVGDADQRLAEVFVFEARGAQHRARAGAMGALNQSVAAQFAA